MADPDHHIREGGGGHPDPEIREEGPSSKNFFSHRATVWSKNKGVDPPGPFPGSATVTLSNGILKSFFSSFLKKGKLQSKQII